MGEVLAGRAARLVWPIAWLWVSVVAPLELATTLTGWLGHPAREWGGASLALIVSRILVVAFGLILGRQLTRPDAATPARALRWACLDLVTLAIVLATDVLPSSRVPGSAPVVWIGYAALDGLVLVAARRPPP